MNPHDPPTIESSLLSHVGTVREDNQDAVRASEPDSAASISAHGHLYAVADGMGGYSHGGVASALALETFFTTFYAGSPSQPPQTMRHAIQQANLAVYHAAHRLNAGRMGTTLTAINLNGGKLHIAHVGDSRLYLVRKGNVSCLTNDHTPVGELVRMRVLSPDKVRGHYQRSMLNKSIGIDLFVQPDITQVAVQEGDIFILCSDGVWAVIEDHEFGTLAGDADNMAALSQRLIDLAIERETDDNVSAIAVHVQRLAVSAEAEEAPARAWGVTRLFSRFSAGR